MKSSSRVPKRRRCRELDKVKQRLIYVSVKVRLKLGGAFYALICGRGYFQFNKPKIC